MTAVLTQYCNIRCEHCYLPSIDYIPGMEDDLSKDDFMKTVKVISDQFSDDIEDIYLTGGEFMLLSYARDIVKTVKNYFPKSTVYAYTNGIPFLEDESLFDDVKPDYFHIGIDTWHSNVKENGKCEIAEIFIDRMKKTGDFKLIFHWTAQNDESDRELYKKFNEKYNDENKDLIIEYRPLNTNLGRSSKYSTPKYNKANNWKKCSFADHIMIRFDGLCYGCHWGLETAILDDFTSSNLKKKREKLKELNLYKILNSDNQYNFFVKLTEKYNINMSINSCGICEKLVSKGVDLIAEADNYWTC